MNKKEAFKAVKELPQAVPSKIRGGKTAASHFSLTISASAVGGVSRDSDSDGDDGGRHEGTGKE